MPKDQTTVPLWAEVVRDTIEGSLPEAALESAIKFNTADDAFYGRNPAAQTKLDYQTAAELLSTREKLQLDWLEANLSTQFEELTPAFRTDHWRFLRVRLCDRVLRDASLTGLSCAVSSSPVLQERTNPAKLGAVLRGMCDGLLGTDALLNRPKVRYSIERFTRRLGDLSGSWVGRAIHNNCPLSDIFASLALAFAVDAWRFWAMADRWSEYDIQKNVERWQDPEKETRDDWRRFLSNLVHCRISAEASIEAASAEAAGNDFNSLRHSIDRNHTGGSVDEVLEWIWPDFRVYLNDCGEGAHTVSDWYGVLSAHKSLRTGALGVILSEEIACMHVAKDLSTVRPPNWSASRLERWKWMFAGGEIEAADLERVFG